MTYQGFEVSPSAGNPVELYQFALAPTAAGGGLGTVPAPPAAPGNLIVGDALLSPVWGSLDYAAATLTMTYPPPTGFSFDGWPSAPSGLAELWNVYQGMIGGTGWFRRFGSFGPTQGLAPGTNYVVRTLEKSFSDGLVLRGISVPSPWGDGLIRSHDTPAPPPIPWGWIDIPATTDGSGDLHVMVGWNLTEESDANIVYVGAMMIFDATGTPAGGGQPYGTGAAAAFVASVLNYTSADVPITYEGTTYTPALIERQSFKSRQDGLSKAEVDVALDLNNPIAQMWFVSGHLPIAPVTCRILRVHANDLTDHAEPFFGQVIRTKIVGKKVILTLASVERLTERRIPRVFNQRLCNNFLGDQVCGRGLNLLARSFTTGMVSAITTGGLVVTVPGAQAFATSQVSTEGLDLTYFKDGVLVAANGDRGWIQGQSGDVLTLGDTIPSLAVGQAVIVQPGCDLSFLQCAVKFQNTKNRRAMDLIPQRNPFVGSGLL